MNYLLEGQQSERLLFRKLTPADFSTWLEFFHHPLSNKYWKSEITEPEELCHQWFMKIFDRYKNNKGGMNVLIDRKTGKFVGQCGLLIQTVDGIEELEVGYAIMPECWSKGYATEAARKCMAYAFNNNLCKSLISIIHENNIESERVAQKNNMLLDKRTLYSNNPVKIYRIKNTVSQ